MEVRGFEPLTSTLRTDSGPLREPLGYNGSSLFPLVCKGPALPSPYSSMPSDYLIPSTVADKMRTRIRTPSEVTSGAARPMKPIGLRLSIGIGDPTTKFGQSASPGRAGPSREVERRVEDAKNAVLDVPERTRGLLPVSFGYQKHEETIVSFDSR